MRNTILLPTFAVAAAALLVTTGCGRKEPPAAQQTSSPSTSGSSRGRSDYSKPNLTEEKLTRFIDSMQEAQNPLEFIFKPGGAMRSMADMKLKEGEMNAFARRYGFRDYVEYIDTWGRVMVGQMQIGAAKMFKGLAESTQKNIDAAEAKLRNPSLSPDDRKMYTDQVEQGRKSLADLTKNDANGLNAADLALVEKFNDRIDEAAKKHRKP